MARSQHVRHLGRLTQAAQAAGWLTRAAAATAIAAACGLPLLAGTAHAAAGSVDVQANPATASLQLSVTSMSPAYARAGETLTISGRVRNPTNTAVTGLSLQFWSSTVPLPSDAAVVDYAHGTYLAPGQSPVSGSAPIAQPSLAAGHSWAWTAKVPVSGLGLSCFGVYPLTAVISDSVSSQAASDPIPLPFWPAKHIRCAGRSSPHPFPISWVWPLIDSPHQSACGGLVDNNLAASIAQGGRLSTLLDTGSRFAAADLTWAIDPALLDNLRTMTHPHLIGPVCGKRRSYPPSSQARAWLTSLLKATASSTVFVTPYADVDVAALTQYGDPFFNLAFTDGDLVAHQVLRRATIPEALPSGPGKLSAVAWPAGGAASPGVLSKLALNVSTVILTMPPTLPGSVTPGAVSSFLTGIGRRLHILLADHGIAELLGSPEAGSRQAGAVFGVSQLYLAETAQIVAEAPGVVRPIVVTPPRRWDPARRLANGLLTDTVQAPWLSPATAGQLVSMPARHGSLPQSLAGRELSARLLHRVAMLDRQVSLLESIRIRPDQGVYRAVFGIESSSWRGNQGRNAEVMLMRTARYVRSQVSGLSINASPYVTLGGKVSTVPVVIHNSLNYPVQVRLAVHSTGAIVTMARSAPVRVLAHSYSAAIRLTVRTTGSDQGVIRMGLTSPGGTPLPATSRIMHVKSTDFGTVALVICAAALAVFVAASAARALRHGRPGPEALADEGDADGDWPPAGPGPSGGMVPQSEPEARSWSPPPAADGQVQAAEPGSVVPRGQPGYVDSVGYERPELTTTERTVTEKEPAAPGQRPTEEHQ